MNVWQRMTKPIIGLAPMDGVTDVAFRKIVDTYGHPSIMFTEFVPVEALKAGAKGVLRDFLIHDIKVPTIAQLYGVDLEGFRIATLIVCELGFEGIDINMGCPAKSVATRGAGAGLIRNPTQARAIIQTVRQATYDWANGAYQSANISDAIRLEVRQMKKEISAHKDNTPSLSVKTRLGYKQVEVETWLSELAQEPLAAITVHGRTYVQGYGGKASWDDIAQAAQIIRKQNAGILVLGNGDIVSKQQAVEYCATYVLDGALVGRGAWGNPWVFTDHAPSQQERLRVALEHTKVFAKLLPQTHFAQIRKHLGWYCHGFRNANVIHEQLIHANSVSEVEDIISSWSSQQKEQPME